MSGIFQAGETKVRPGVYFRTENGGGSELAGATDGVVAVTFKANWGPLNKVVTIEAESEILDSFGDDTGANCNTEIIRKILSGGARRVKVVRVGNGGTNAEMTLKDPSDIGVVRLLAKYPGARELSVTVKDTLADPSNKRECVIYSGTRELTKVEFAKGTDEPEALTAAINLNTASVVSAVKLADGDGEIETISQVAFTNPGTSPTTTSTDYSNAMSVLESESWNVLCVDSNDKAIHALVKNYITRVNEAGLMAMAVISEPISVALETRKANAAAMNSCNIVYVLSGAYAGETLYDG